MGMLSTKNQKQQWLTFLQQKKAKEEAADSPQPAKAQYTKKANVQINVEVEEAMKSLYAEGPIRHVLIRIDEKKKKKKRSYYAELASTGEGCLQPVIDGISADLETIFFAAFRVDTSDNAGSKREKYVWSQIQGKVDAMRSAKLMSFSADIADLAT